MEENFILGHKNWKIDQISYVYKDVEKQAKIMETLYNAPKFTFIESIEGVVKYRGRKTKVTMKWGSIRFLNTQIEYIQWLRGECIYKEFLDQGKEGFHHIGIQVKDIQASVGFFKKKGIKVLQSDTIYNLRFVYLDTEKTFGILIRLFDIVKDRKNKND